MLFPGPRYARLTQFDPATSAWVHCKANPLSAYEHGQNAATRRKHLQACPFDSGTVDWRQWRDGFLVIPFRDLSDFKALSNPVVAVPNYCKPVLFDR